MAAPVPEIMDVKCKFGWCLFPMHVIYHILLIGLLLDLLNLITFRE
jgi:hypothetical protein